METKVLDKWLVQGDGVLSVFDTRYSQGIMAFIANDEEQAAEVIDQFNGGDIEAVSCDLFFQNAVAPAAFDKTVMGAIAKLEAKLAGIPEELQTDYWDLAYRIRMAWKVRLTAGIGTYRPSPALLAEIAAFEERRKAAVWAAAGEP